MLLGRVDAKVPLGPTMKETLTPASRASDRSEHTPTRVLCAHCGLETLVRGKETWGLGSKAIAAEILAADRLSGRVVQDGSLSLSEGTTNRMQTRRRPGLQNLGGLVQFQHPVLNGTVAKLVKASD